MKKEKRKEEFPGSVSSLPTHTHSLSLSLLSLSLSSLPCNVHPLATMGADYYGVLGVVKKADDAELKKGESLETTAGKKKK